MTGKVLAPEIIERVLLNIGKFTKKKEKRKKYFIQQKIQNNNLYLK